MAFGLPTAQTGVRFTRNLDSFGCGSSALRGRLHGKSCPQKLPIPSKVHYEAWTPPSFRALSQLPFSVAIDCPLSEMQFVDEQLAGRLHATLVELAKTTH
jgi:hypothetical protein